MSKRQLRKKVIAGTGAALGAGVVFAPVAQAGGEMFVVDTLDDHIDLDLCDPGSDCTLREAIREANGDADPDTVTFASGLSGTLTLNGTQLEINSAMTIQGPGADVIEVSGNDSTRIIEINALIEGDAYDPVTISGLTLSGGNSYALNGGALYSVWTTLTLDGMVFTGNTANGAGAVWSDGGRLFISNSLFSGNDSANKGGALYVQDTEGTAADDVEVSIQNSSFTGNTATRAGGAILTSGPEDSILIENTTISGNSTDDGGGAAALFMDDGDLTIRGSTLSSNSAFYGGALFFDTLPGNLLIENTTISGNEADGDGGGVYFDYVYEDNTTTIRNSTVVDNAAGVDPEGDDTAGGGIYLYEDSDGGVGDDANGPITLSSTIVANNSAPVAPDLGAGSHTDGFEVGFSLIEFSGGARDPQDAEITETPAGTNLFGVDPVLGALAANGGPTQTHLPAATSPTIDKGIANGLTTDQRGVPRTFDGVAFANAPGGDGTDIGSVEVQPGEGGLPGNAQCQGATVPEFKGTDGNDTLTGTPASDFLRGLGGADTANGAGGNDCVNGDAGKDKLKGAGGKDRVKGGAGKDRLTGGGGKDRLSGQGGKDTLRGGGGKDRLKGGPGKDKLTGGGGKDRFNCGGGKDKVTAQEKDRVSASCEKVVERG